MEQSQYLSPSPFPTSWIVWVVLSCLVFTLLVVRLADLQLVKGADYAQFADENRFFRQPLPAQRGLILDRYGEPLVWNVQQYYRLSDPQALFPRQQPIARTTALQLIATQGAAAVTTAPRRYYRFPESLAHILGYVGEVTAEELQQNSQLKPGMVIGKAGLEAQYQDRLRGHSGQIVYEINALGRKQRRVLTTPASAGQDLGTSLDPYLTELAARRLSGVSGAVIVSDVKTGKVLALTSQPTFDANSFTIADPDPAADQLRRQRIQSFFQDPRKLFFNRAISGVYPPASTFKLITALAGLELNKVDRQTQVVDEGFLKIGEFEFGNWYFRQFGRTEGAIGLERSVARSNDIFFYKLAEWVGPQALAEFARSFGFGQRTGIELPAEARGLVPDPDWKEKVRKEPWFLGNTYHFGIGQGDLVTTPLQINQMNQALANGGLLCPLSVLSADPGRESGVACRQVGVRTENLDIVVKGMMEACTAGGTAFPFFSYNQDRFQLERSTEQNLAAGAVACKTGTAEFGGENERGHRRTHGWITLHLALPSLSSAAAGQSDSRGPAFAELPLDQPVAALNDEQLHRLWRQKVNQFGFPTEVAITVLVESDEAVPFREGSRDAGPIARQLVDWLVKR